MSEVQGEVLFKSSRPTYQDVDALRVFVRAGVVVGVRLQNAARRHGLVVAREVLADTSLGSSVKAMIGPAPPGNSP